MELNADPLRIALASIVFSVLSFGVILLGVFLQIALDSAPSVMQTTHKKRREEI